MRPKSFLPSFLPSFLSFFLLLIILGCFNLRLNAQPGVPMNCGFKNANQTFNQLESRSVGCSVPGKAKIVNVNFHFISRTNGTGNYTATGNINGPGYNGNQFAADLLNTCNYLLANNHKLYQPVGNNTPIQPVNIQHASKGVYFWNNDVLFNNNALVSGFGAYDPIVQNENTTINIFISGFIPSQGYDGVTYLGSSRMAVYKIVQWNPNETKVHPELTNIKMHHFMFADVINHELGHIIDLIHPFDDNKNNNGGISPCNFIGDRDGCPDTRTMCETTSCYQPLAPLINPFDQKQCTDPDKYTNTFMDQSINWKAYSPCQISLMNNYLQSTKGDYYGCLTSNFTFNIGGGPATVGPIYTSSCAANTIPFLGVLCQPSPCTSFRIAVAGPYGTFFKDFFSTATVYVDLGSIHTTTGSPQPLPVGTYTVTRTSKAGYAVSTDTKSIQIKKPNGCGFALKLAPNPANNIVTIGFTIENDEDIIGINLYDKVKSLKVKELKSMSKFKKGDYELQFDLSSFSTGTYLVEVIGLYESDTETLQIIRL